MRAPVLALATALAACSGAGAKLSVSTKVAQASGAPVAKAGATGAALAIGDHVTLDRARFLIRKVALEPEGTDAAEAPAGVGTPDGSGSVTAAHPSGTPEVGEDAGPDDAVVWLGPLVIDLSGAALDGGVKLVFDEPVPAGTYESLKIQIHGLTPGESVADADFAPLGHSIILGLHVDGTPVTFTSDLTATAEVEGPFVVAEGGKANVTLTIDPTGWFTAPDGTFLDPGVDANRSAIEQNIRKSIRGFQDDDRDGKPDGH